MCAKRKPTARPLGLFNCGVGDFVTLWAAQPVIRSRSAACRWSQLSLGWSELTTPIGHFLGTSLGRFSKIGFELRLRGYGLCLRGCPWSRHTVRMAIPKPTGRPPKPDAQRRRANKPASYGLAKPVVAGEAAEQPEALGFTAHQMITDMWKALATSVEGQFFSDADWQRARWELWYANGLMTGERQLTAPAWNVAAR